MEALTTLPGIADQKFDLITSVEAWHMLPHPAQALKQAHSLLEQDCESRLVIADGFLQETLEETE